MDSESCSGSTISIDFFKMVCFKVTKRITKERSSVCLGFLISCKLLVIAHTMSLFLLELLRGRYSSRKTLRFNCTLKMWFFLRISKLKNMIFLYKNVCRRLLTFSNFLKNLRAGWLYGDFKLDRVISQRYVLSFLKF